MWVPRAPSKCHAQLAGRAASDPSSGEGPGSRCQPPLPFSGHLQGPGQGQTMGSSSWVTRLPHLVVTQAGQAKPGCPIHSPLMEARGTQHRSPPSPHPSFAWTVLRVTWYCLLAKDLELGQGWGQRLPRFPSGTSWGNGMGATVTGRGLNEAGVWAALSVSPGAAC